MVISFSSWVKARFKHQVVLATVVYLLVWLTVKLEIII